jgi:hypothetical protein
MKATILVVKEYEVETNGTYCDVGCPQMADDGDNYCCLFKHFLQLDDDTGEVFRLKECLEKVKGK